MVETCCSVPFSESIFSSYLLCFWIGSGGGERFDGWGEGLDAAVERGGVEALDWRGEGLEVCGEFVGLFDAVAGEGWVGGDSCWGGDGGCVFAGAVVDDPIGSELFVGLVEGCGL